MSGCDRCGKPTTAARDCIECRTARVRKAAELARWSKRKTAVALHLVRKFQVQPHHVEKLMAYIWAVRRER